MYDVDQQRNGRGHPALIGGKSQSDTLADQTPESEYVSFDEILEVLWRRLWLIVMTAVVLAGLAVAYSIIFQPPEYTSSVKIWIHQKQGADATQGGLGSEVQGLQAVTATMVEAVNSRSVAAAVIQRRHLSMTPEEFLTHLSAEPLPDTQFIQVSYTGTDPEVAQRRANAIGDVFLERLSQGSSSAGAITATVWDTAAVPQTPTGPKPLQYGLFAFLLGTLLGVGLAFLLERLDHTWQSPEEAAQFAGVPIFGVVPEFKAPKRKKEKQAT